MSRFKAEKTVVAHLSSALDAAVSVSVPQEMPTRLVTVERVGGSNDGVAVDRPRIAVQSWAQTWSAALDLAHEVDAAMSSLAGARGVALVELEQMYAHPDENKKPRYQCVYALVAHLYV